MRGPRTRPTRLVPLAGAVALVAAGLAAVVIRPASAATAVDDALSNVISTGSICASG